jgi:hypothetical protein
LEIRNWFSPEIGVRCSGCDVKRGCAVIKEPDADIIGSPFSGENAAPVVVEIDTEGIRIRVVEDAAPSGGRAVGRLRGADLEVSVDRAGGLAGRLADLAFETGGKYERE